MQCGTMNKPIRDRLFNLIIVEPLALKEHRHGPSSLPYARLLLNKHFVFWPAKPKRPCFSLHDDPTLERLLRT